MKRIIYHCLLCLFLAVVILFGSGMSFMKNPLISLIRIYFCASLIFCSYKLMEYNDEKAKIKHND